jgi:hypothetical protein
VVSPLQGLRDVIVEAQTVLLDAAIKADVRRFIPSDYSIDFTKFPPGENRNLDLRRDFHKRLDKSTISATTIYMFKLKRVLYWGDADQRMDFTTIDDTAAFTASAALDPSTPRFVRIAGDQLSARELTAVVSEVTGGEVPPVSRRRSGNARHAYQGRAGGRSQGEGALPGMAGHAVHA